MQLRLDVKGCVSKAAFRRVYEEGVVVNRRLEVGGWERATGGRYAYCIVSSNSNWGAPFCPPTTSHPSHVHHISLPAHLFFPGAIKVLRAAEPLSAQRLLRQCVELTSMARLFEEVRALIQYPFCRPLLVHS